MEVFDASAGKSVVTAMDKSSRNQQPFMGQDQNGNPVIVGDVNDVDSGADYVVEFLYPKGYAINGDYQETPQGLLVHRVLKDKKITPRTARKLRHAVSVLIVNFSKINESTGSTEIMTIADVANVYEKLPNDVVSAMEDVVQYTLGITDMDMEYLTDGSLIHNATQLILNNSGFFQRDSE